MASRPDKQVVGNVGLYYCCYQLSLRGWNVMPTARNAKGVDIVIYNADATAYRGIQVKTLSERPDVPLGTILKVMGDFWVIVNNAVKSPKAFVLTPAQVMAGAVENRKDGKSSFWLARGHYERADFAEAWDQIGLGHARDELPGGGAHSGPDT